jgi:hypothetical protein
MRTAVLSLAALALLAGHATAQGKPNFAGNWTLNMEKSDPMGGGPGGGGGGGGRGMGMGSAPLAITQTGDKLVIEIKSATPRTMSYALDGTESVNPGMRGAETKSKARWEGESLVIESTTAMSTPNGDVTITTKEVRTASADGKMMTVVTTTQTPMGERTMKRVYDKQP